MRNNYQSKAVPRGTRTIWRYLGALFLLFTFAIGQMWGTTSKQGTYYLFYGSNVHQEGNNLNETDFVFPGGNTNGNESSDVTIDDKAYRHYVKPASYGATSLSSLDMSKVFVYSAKTSSTKLTIYVKNNKSSAKDYYIDYVFQGETTATSARNYKKNLAKSGNSGDREKKVFEFTNADKKNVTIFFMPGEDIRFYQIIAEETGDDLPNVGEEGYSLSYRYGTRNGLVKTFEGLEFSSTSNKNGMSGDLSVFTVSSGYIKFTTPDNGKNVLLNANHSSTKALKIEALSELPTSTSGYSQLGTAVTETKKKLSPNTTYMMFSINSSITMKSVSFSTPKVSYDANGGSGSMSATDWTVAANGFTAPSGKKFDGWKDADNKVHTVGQEELEDVTLYAQWKDDVVEYTVTKGTHANGDFTITPATQAEGEKVTLVATPNFRYLFDAWEVVKTEDGSATGIVVDGNGQFDMPAYAVTVNATFAADSRKQILYLTSNTAEATASDDKLYAALNAVVDYNVIVEAPGSQTLTNYDLIVLHESIGGISSEAAVTGCKTTSVPVLNTKSYFYGADKDASKRWTWGAPNAGTSVNGATMNSAYCNIASHPLFSGVTVSEGFIAITADAADKCMQPVGSFATGYEGYTLATTPNAATPGGTGCAIHEIPAGTTARGATSGKYLMISVSNAKLNALNANGQQLFQNAAAYLIGSTSWTPATVPTSPAVAATPSENYTEGNTITLTASATGTSASTTYTWYKGDNWAAASATTPIQAAATDGNVFTKTAAMEDAGTYWCNISNGTSCDAQASVTITVASASAPTYDITYVSAHGTTPDADDAASVVLAELNADGWAHKGWTADVDVTVDAATVVAGTLIANGKTAILASDVTFTAVWKEIFTLQFDSKDGSAVAEQSIEDGGHPTAVENPTKDGYIFLGWSETDGDAVVADITALTISGDKTLFAKWALDIQLTEIVFSNSFKGWINGSTVTAFYMEGESAPTLVSYAGTNLKAADAVAIVGNEVIATGSDDSEKHYTLTMTAVAPLTTTGVKQTFDGEDEDYVKSAYGWKWHETETSKQKGWAFQKLANDGRIAKGLTREYFFFGPAESATFTWKVAKKNSGDPAVAYVYVDGVLTNTVTSTTDAVVVPLKKTKSIVAFESAQTNGDCGLKDVTLAPWIPVTAVTLKEGEDAISSKSIWESTNFTLTAEVTPDNASNKTITWTSSNDAVATVVNGVVTGVAANATPVTITASTVDGVTATCTVTVTEAPSPCETPTVNTQPAGSAYCAGSEPTLTVVAEVSDEGTLHYAWYKKGETDTKVGSDAASYTVEAAGTYYVIVTNKKDGKLDASVTSDDAVVTLNVAAAITTQPKNKMDIVSGSPVTLSVVATNATGYQWYICDDAEKHNASAISGAASADYVFNCSANAYYYCVVGNACGADIESDVVSVKLEPVGCNTFESKPDAEPYSYTQTGEWSFYFVDSNGADKSTDNVFTDGKNFDDEDAIVANTRRFALNFAKDVESVTLYGVGGSDKAFTHVSVADAMVKNTYTELTTTATKTDITDKKHIFTVDNVIIPAGKYAWFEFSGSLNFFKICYTTALAEPVLPTLSNQELCAGAAIAAFDATITNAAACEGTVSYKWFSTADTETPVATTAEFTPSTDGTYYVVVTHSAAGHITRTAQSANLSVAHFDALTLVSHSEDVFLHMGTAATLSVVATGKNVAYVWYTCSNAAGDDAVAITPAETENELTIASILEGVHYYKVVISHDCDATTLSHVFKVEGWDQLEQVDVTASTVWDMNNVSANAINLKDDYNPSKQNVRLLLANIEGVNNNASFNSQALMFEGQHIGRTEGNVKHLAGRYVQFNVTVPGAVFVTFASNGNNARTISINGKKCARTTSGTAADKYITYALAVEPGSVEIVGYEGESANQYVRISKIEFKAEDNYHRAVNPSYLGTLCWKNNAILGGATLYKFVGKNENNYLEFEDVPENRIEAGKPYIFMPENGSTEIRVYNIDDAAALTEDQEPVNHMYGTITGKTLVPGVDDNMYYFSSNHIWAVKDFAVNIPVPAYYCYVDYVAVLNDNPAPAPAPGRRRVTMGVQGEQVVTGINAIEASEKPMKLIIDGQMFILRGQKMFDATGRLVK